MRLIKIINQRADDFMMVEWSTNHQCQVLETDPDQLFYHQYAFTRLTKIYYINCVMYAFIF